MTTLKAYAELQEQALSPYAIYAAAMETGWKDQASLASDGPSVHHSCAWAP